MKAVIGASNTLFGLGLCSVLKDDLGFSKLVVVRSCDELMTALETRVGVKLLAIDLALPGMARGAYINILRERYPSLLMAVIADSMRREDMLRALSEGAQGYIPSNLPLSMIASGLREVLAGRIYVPSVIAHHSSYNLEDAPPPAADTGHAMSSRQREVLELIAVGDSIKAIARKLDLAEGTVKAHIAAVYRKLGVNNRVGAARALAQGHI